MTAFVENLWVLGAASGLGGAVLTLTIQLLVAKRGLFTYSVIHNRVGVGADDPTFGDVKVTWNDRPIPHLYISTVEIRNESLRDYTGVVARVWSTTTQLLTERTEVEGTTHTLRWAPEYAALVAATPEQGALPDQMAFVYGRRDYLLATMNRGQVVRITFINAANSTNEPSIWVDILHPGVRIDYRVVSQQFWGVPQPAAALIGLVTGVGVIALIAALISSLPLAATLSFLYGVIVVIPGALLIRAWRRVRTALGD